MKKFITMITALVCVAAMAISASAAEFVPSVVQSNKAPEVVSATDKDGNTVDIKTAGMADATGDAKTALDAAYKDLTEKKVTDLVSADDLQKAAGNTKIDDLVVKDLFAILVNGAAAGTGAAKTDATTTDGKASPKTGETVSVAAVAACASFVVLAGAAVVMGKKKSA